ncbi:WXG100 family type VII secretion target [Nocardioides coralli]|uniref:WXG100 family type VII secretion target n=1 Tax=Nocardioides coralli TaxID=2872154 RepID=UPI001CA387D6|nr:WXG100 family type VII secretion target [Nocardioides coralli]QZY29725.1 WXG100 family type VII secretion target [Nocardioides coralli]
MTPERFRVDLDHLADVVAQLERDHARLVALADRLGARVARLHDDWEGAAAAAHLVAQARWDHGFAQMRTALAAMAGAAGTARRNYATAGETNLAMWRQVG